MEPVSITSASERSARHCERCGTLLSALAPKGLCPACMLLCGLDSGAEAADESAEPAADAGAFCGALDPADQIGPYKLLQKIGEGGCGVVFMAEQSEPIRRQVALKIIKLGMDTQSVIARFEAERQALALMDHPNIAQVLDAGANASGRPYFVMELVRGVPITKYCDEQRLNPEQRLLLFIQVCRAVQHAHQKGVIHRDLKPSNILVANHDGVPAPKIIDFGIAKATGGQLLTNKTIFTAFEQFLGTPAYMSPEQAKLSSLDIDTRSDIYSLGVLLYELLTGRTPFEGKRLAEAGLDEARRIIQQEEPTRPSTRLRLLPEDELISTARQRHTDGPKLIHVVRGDLDWIVIKALEKDRARRYETANGLAVDVDRHLKNETVVARPASTGYRVQRFLRRHKLLSTALAGMALAFALGLFASAFEMGQRARSRAFQQSEARSLETLAYSLAGNGRWKEAAADFSRLADLEPSNHWCHLWLAPLLAVNGDLDGYRRHCAQVLAVFGGTQDPVVAERMAKACLIIPISDVNLEAAARLADKAVTLGNDHPYFPYFELAKGLAEYRLGHFDSAIVWARKALVYEGKSPNRDAQAYLVLALAQHQAGDENGARASLGKGEDIIKTALPKLESGNIGDGWNDRLIAQALLNEARKAIFPGGS